MAQKSLKEIYELSVIQAKYSAPVDTECGKLFQWKGRMVPYVTGELKFSRAPFFGLILADKTASIPCVMANSNESPYELLTSNGLNVLITEPLIISEIFSSPTAETESVVIVLDLRKLQLTWLEDEDENLLCEENRNAGFEYYQDFIPLKISSAVSTLKSEVFCFILAVLLDSRKLDSDDHKRRWNDTEGILPSGDYKCSDNLVWFVLKNEQVWWKDLLVTNTIHTIAVPNGTPTDYFRSPTSLFAAFKNNVDSFLYDVLHHKDLIKTDLLVTLPENCSIFTTRLDQLTNFEDWCSVAAVKSYAAKFGCVYGTVKEIRYKPSRESKMCLWCGMFKRTNQGNFDNDSHFAKKMQNLDASLLHHYRKYCHESEKNKFWFPLSSPSNSTAKERLSGFGINGGKWCAQILLEQSDTGDKIFLYINNWALVQGPIGLVAGVDVYITDIHIKCSVNNNIYLVGTPFTRILQSNTHEGTSAEFVDERFRFPDFLKDNEPAWGILSWEKLLNASINAKCKLCRNYLEAYRCSHSRCPNSNEKVDPDYEISADATLLIETKKGPVYLHLKDDHVRIYLDFPHDIWRHLCKSSVKSNFYYSHTLTDLPDDIEIEDLFFKRYCRYDRPKLMFEVLCRPMRDKENRYFCVELRKCSDD